MSETTLAQAKSHIRLASGAADTVLQTYLDGCEEWLAKELGIALTSDTVSDEYVDGGGDILLCQRKPVTAISEVYDNLEEETVDSSEYYVDSYGVARVLAETDPWGLGANRYKVSYTGGYVTIPGGVTLLVLELVARVFRNPDGRVSEGSAVGGSISWAKLCDSDIGHMIVVQSMRAFV